MSWFMLVLLAAAIAVLVGAEWPRLEERFGSEARRRRDRERRKASLTLLHCDPAEADDADEFAASVQRDLSRLPTIDVDREERR